MLCFYSGNCYINLTISKKPFPFSLRTIRHIAAETLAAIREVHELGFLLRNVRPNDFNIGNLQRMLRSAHFGVHFSEPSHTLEIQTS